MSVQVEFNDWVVAQDPEESVNRIGELINNSVSETVTWKVNEKEQFTMTWPEFTALLEAAGVQ